MKAVDLISEDFTEKRCSSSEQRALWSGLSLLQKRNARKLYKVGYELTFLSNDNLDKMAIMFNGVSLLTINGSGNIGKFSKIITEEVELIDTHHFSN